MSIEYAVLGILQKQPATGYDVKKVMQDSPFMHWSGNNNQVYKALTFLAEKGYVTGETIHTDGAPSKKVYTTTDAGKDALAAWVKTPCDADDLRKPFLLRLAMAGALDAATVLEMLSRHEIQVKMQMEIDAEKASGFFADANGRAALLDGLIRDNLRLMHEAELAWIAQAREALSESTMQFTVMDFDGTPCLVCESGQLAAETDVNTMLEAVFSNDVRHVLLPAEALSDAFFDLKTGLAGELMQKLANYNIKGAVLLTEEALANPRFQELRREYNSGGAFAVCESWAEAQSWLMA